MAASTARRLSSQLLSRQRRPRSLGAAQSVEPSWWSGWGSAAQATSRGYSFSTTAAVLSPTRLWSTGSASSAMSSVVQVDPNVRAALVLGGAVVALESTIVAHGMPFPQNRELARRVVALLRDRNVEPATVAVRDGIFRVGLSAAEVEDLARAGEQGRARKCSTRDLSLVAAAATAATAPHDATTTTTIASTAPSSTTEHTTQWGATTVASTMTLAHRAGIATFVTGGIGGVHRNGHISLDVSADLLELSRTPVVVVCAGIKSILDIPRTLEVLETYGVPTVAYQTDEFPAFFSPHSGVPSPARVDTPQEIARAYWSARDLGLPHGMLVAVPNSDPAGANVEDAIQSALAEAEERQIHGAAITPYLLRRVAEMTGGDSLRSNMALVERNATVGAEIALAIAEQVRERGEVCSVGCTPSHLSPPPHSRVVVLGGILLDLVAKPEPGIELLLGTSNPAICTESDGGVGRNIAEVLGRLGARPLLYSVVGNDARGMAIVQRLQDECGVQSTGTVHVIENANTASYIAVLEATGDLHTACADTAVFSHIRAPPLEVLRRADALVLDANPPLEILQEAALRANQVGTVVYFDPTSAPKALKSTQDPVFLSCVTCAFPNRDELRTMAQALWDPDRTWDGTASLEEQAACVLARMHPGPAQLVVTLGERGVLLASREAAPPAEPPSFQYFDATSVSVVNATGAGDTLCGAFVQARLDGRGVEEAVRVGMEAAELSLTSNRTISDRLGMPR